MRPAGMLPPMTQRFPGRRLLGGAAVMLLALTACADDGDSGGTPAEDSGQDAGAETTGQDGAEGAEAGYGTLAEAEMHDQAGNLIGTVTIAEAGEGRVEVRAEVQDLQPGLRGISIHETGLCELQSADEYGQIGDFLSAGGHLAGSPQEDSGVVDGEDVPEDLTQDPELPEDMAPEEQAEVYHPEHAGTLPNLLVNEDRTGVLSVVTDRLDEDLLLDEDGSAVIVHAQADNAANIPERYAPQGPDYETLTTGDSGARVACGVLEAP